MDSMSKESGRLLPLPEAAAILFGGVRGPDCRVRASESTNIKLRGMLRRNEIDYVRVGRRYYIPKVVIDDLTS